MQIPHLDTLSHNRGWIITSLLEGNDALSFYMGDVPDKLLQRTVLGMTDKRFNEVYKNYSKELDTVAPLLQPKDALLTK